MMEQNKSNSWRNQALALLAGLALLASLAGVSLQNVSAAGTGPCDIYASGGTPCVAAHSTVRALFGAYSGRLYQVKRASNGNTTDIGTLSAGGVANAAAQDSFCSGTTCTITIIYDQSGRGNDLTPAPAGGAKNTPDNPANATALPITINGQKAYGVSISAGMGYRRDNTSGIATGDAAEAMYMVTSGTHFNGGCCFDYGNAETNNNDDGAGTMEAVFFGNIKVWTFGTGNGPWVMADLENGLFGCAASPNGSLCSNNPTISNTFVTAMVKGHSGNSFGLKEGNSQSGGLATVYNGARPSGYSPMKKQGAIILGIGGDNSNSSIGSFYEGVMVTGDPSDATDNAVQANIVAAGYGKTASTTATPTPGPSLTPTRTPTPGPSLTPTRTPTPGGSGSTCSPVTSTITAPFTFDGAGTFCWQTASLGSFINSWNMASVTLNGVNITNLYVASGSYPAKVNGFYYIGYTGNFPWSHFETK